MNPNLENVLRSINGDDLPPRLWAIPGPKNSMITLMSAFMVKRSVIIVQEFSEGGWDIYMPSNHMSPAAVIREIKDHLAKRR